MNPIHNPAILPALAAVCGSFIGALGSGLSAWIAQRHEDRRTAVEKRVLHREQLYAEFISESAQAMVDAMQHAVGDTGKLITVYALINRIRLSSSTNVVKSAERVASSILIAQSKPTRTPEQIQAEAGTQDDPLREFSDICRRELESLASAL